MMYTDNMQLMLIVINLNFDQSIDSDILSTKISSHLQNIHYSWFIYNVIVQYMFSAITFKEVKEMIFAF